MDPYTMAITTAVGVGFQVAGMIGGQSSTNKYNDAQTQELELQRKAEAQKRQLATLQHGRNQLEIYRGAQRARAVALTNATAQGAGQGSGLQGGYGQIAGMEGTNLVSENQNFQIGQNIFDINNAITDTRIAGSKARQDMQFWNGLSSFGSSIMGAAGPASKAVTQIWGGQQSAPGV